MNYEQRKNIADVFWYSPFKENRNIGNGAKSNKSLQEVDHERKTITISKGRYRIVAKDNISTSGTVDGFRFSVFLYDNKGNFEEYQFGNLGRRDNSGLDYYFGEVIDALTIMLDKHSRKGFDKLYAYLTSFRRGGYSNSLSMTEQDKSYFKEFECKIK